MTETGYWVSLSYATFGIFSADHIIVTDAAPIAYWLVKQKKTVAYALDYYRKKGAVIRQLNNAVIA